MSPGVNPFPGIAKEVPLLEPSLTVRIAEQRRPNLFFCPIPSALNPEMERAREHTLTWIQEMGFITTEAALRALDEQRLDIWSAGQYPLASGDTFNLLHDWVVWAALVDDYLEVHDPGHHGTLVADLITVVSSSTPKVAADVTPPVRALADLWQRTIRCPMPSGWHQRQATWWTHWFESYAWEAACRQSRTWPSLSRYLEHRLWAGACPPLLGNMILGHDCPVSERLLATPEIRLLMRLASEHTTFVNDIYGYARDTAWGDYFNTLNFLGRERDHDLAEAVRVCIAMADETMRAFLRVESLLPTLYKDLAIPRVERDNANRMIDGFRAWVRGDLDYHLIARRYDQRPQDASYHKTDWMAAQTAWSTRDQWPARPTPQAAR